MSSHPTPPPRVVIIMGVSGSGKSVIGQRLATAWGAVFDDADAFHPPENVAKMSALMPLTDADRQPWLARMTQEIVLAPADAGRHVLACSALKRSYRETLRADRNDVWFLYLQGSYYLIHERMLARTDHFMKADLLRSQFTTLEEPLAEPRTLVVPITGSVDQIVASVLQQWSD